MVKEEAFLTSQKDAVGFRIRKQINDQTKCIIIILIRIMLANEEVLIILHSYMSQKF